MPEILPTAVILTVADNVLPPMLPAALIKPLEITLPAATLPMADTTPSVDKFPPLILPVALMAPDDLKLPACTLPVALTTAPCTVPVVLTELVEPLVSTDCPLTCSTLSPVTVTGIEFM